MDAFELERVCTGLTTRGWALVPSFSDPIPLRREALGQDGFHFAGTGRAHGFALRPELRRDRVRWLDPGSLRPAELAVWEKLEELREALNQNLFLGLRWFECHFSIYSPGDFYRKHRDTFAGVETRRLSFVFYLNEGWTVEDGGQLRLYAREGKVDILPRGGDLVCFLSEEIEHEVLPTLKHRTSLTGWFRVDMPGSHR